MCLCIVVVEEHRSLSKKDVVVTTTVDANELLLLDWHESSKWNNSSIKLYCKQLCKEKGYFAWTTDLRNSLCVYKYYICCWFVPCRLDRGGLWDQVTKKEKKVPFAWREVATNLE